VYCVVRVSAFCAALALSAGVASATSTQPVEPESAADTVPADDNDSTLDAQAAMPAAVIDRSPLFDDPAFDGVAPERFLFFSGFDYWRSGGSVHGGLLWAPWGLQRDGFIVKAIAGTGSYRYLSNRRSIRGWHTFASLMPGYRWSGQGYEARLFAGLDFQHHWLLPSDPSNSLLGSNIGARINGELWWEPWRNSMVSTSFSASSIGPNYNVRGATGWKLFDSFYAGPELETFSDFHYRQYRAGVHVTALRTGDVEWTAGIGYALDSSKASGMYARLGLLVRR
jgi:hypothetical protein